MSLTVIIPARNEEHLERTIINVLANSRGETNIIVVLDGYLPDPQIHTGDARVTFLHFPESIGQRQAINEAARRTTSKYIMKLDAHCAVDIGFDVELMEAAEVLGYNVTQVPRMYNLDIDTFLPKIHKLTDYMYIGLRENGELRAEYYTGSEYKRKHRNDKKIDDIMCCMGPCFFIEREYFWETGGCDESHGGWGSQGIEVACKAWLSGGRLVVNKNTWFAHWFRGHIGFPYPLSGRTVEDARKYSKDLWLNNKWEKAILPFQFMLDKFKPPGWEMKTEFDEKRMDTNSYLYRHLHKKAHHPRWKGIKILKFPSDLNLYSQVLWQNKPDVIVEIGTKFGGSALYLQDMLDLNENGGKVITIDINPQVVERDPRITYLIGNSTSEEIISQVRELTKDKKTMLIVDGDHHRIHVKWELQHYSPMVTKGQYLVVEDCYAGSGNLYGPGEARDWFLARNKEFYNSKLCDEFLVGICLGGWLRRR
jgi:cephalosporin hydroxylase